MPPDMPAAEVPANLAEHDDDAAVMYSQQWSPALHHDDGARVPDGEALAGNAAEVGLAGMAP